MSQSSWHRWLWTSPAQALFSSTARFARRTTRRRTAPVELRTTAELPRPVRWREDQASKDLRGVPVWGAGRGSIFAKGFLNLCWLVRIRVDRQTVTGPGTAANLLLELLGREWWDHCWVWCARECLAGDEPTKFWKRSRVLDVGLWRVRGGARKKWRVQWDL